uniref:Uncharacterized protein n=1 Tax=Arundo donax TaxID=35708 RepID=A0A0A9BIH9_ARUDO
MDFSSIQMSDFGCSTVVAWFCFVDGKVVHWRTRFASSKLKGSGGRNEKLEG